MANTKQTKENQRQPARAVKDMPRMRDAVARLWRTGEPVALICLGLMGAVFTAYLPVFKNGFINLDDPDYITRNTHVTSGLRWENIAWAFRDTHLGTWHPLTWISHMLDVRLYGLWAGGHHLTNLILHTVNSLLLLLMLRQFTGSVWRSALVAGLFGLHPLHVESVAWASERKDVLSAFFGLLSIWAYGIYVEKSRRVAGVEGRAAGADATALCASSHQGQNGAGRSFYALAVLAFAFGLMSKPMLVTLPLLLLLLDYWPLGRLASSQLPPLPRFMRLVREKAPFFVLSFVAGVITINGQKNAGAMKSAIELPLPDRVGNAVISYVRYLWKTVWPADLAVFYPFPKPWPILLVVAAAGLMLAAAVLVVAQSRRRPYLLVGWFWYVLGITPVIGLIQVGIQGWADRYTYIPLIGVFVIIGWAFPIQNEECRMQNGRLTPSEGEREKSQPCLCNRGLRKVRDGILAVACGAAVVLAWFGTRAQVRYWRSSETLFRHTVAVTRDNALGHQLLAGALFERDDLEAAAVEFRRALEIRPDFNNARVGLAVTLAKEGKAEEACRHFKVALERQPDDAAAHLAFADALSQQGQASEAIAHYEKAVQLQPGLAPAQNNLANALQRAGRVEEAIPHYEAALRAEPTLAEAHNNLGIALAAQGKTTEAMHHYEAAVQNAPDYAEAYYNLGNALASRGKLEEAITNYAAAIKRKPPYAKAENSLGCVLAMLGRVQEALDHFDAAVRASPESAEAHFNLAGALARDGQEQAAIEQFQEALRLQPDIAARLDGTSAEFRSGQDAAALGALASAYASAGELSKASAMLETALALASRSGQTNLLGEFQRRIEEYKRMMNSK